MSCFKKIANSTGFTLIECVVTLLLLGLMSSVGITVTDAFRAKAEQTMLSSETVLTASSCMERVKALPSASLSAGEHDCPNNSSAKYTITEVLAEPFIITSVDDSDRDLSDKDSLERLIRISVPTPGSTTKSTNSDSAPASDSTLPSPFTMHLVKVKAGSMELHHVLK